MLFKKIEDIATHKLDSIKNRSNVFYNEVVKGPNSSGFHHDDRYWLELYNGSRIETFNSDPSKNVGYRCDLLVNHIANFVQKYAYINPFNCWKIPKLIKLQYNILTKIDIGMNGCENRKN